MRTAGAFLLGLAVGLAVLLVVLFVQDRDDDDASVDRDRTSEESPSPVPSLEGSFTLEGVVSAASVTNPVSPAAASPEGAGRGQTGSFDLVVQEFSPSLTQCGVVEAQAATVFIDDETAFEPSELIEDPDFPDNFVDRRVFVEGFIQQTPEDDCRLVGSKIALEPANASTPTP